MNRMVTIGIPMYKRLEYLPAVLRVVAAQDYPNIDLLISDNGMNGTVIPDVVAKHYSKPYRFRQNPSTIPASAHFNQLIQFANGEYFVMLADDDELSPNYVSDLVAVMEKHPEASLALSVQETFDESGKVHGRSKDTVPETLSGPDFIKAIWGTHEFGFRSLSTFLAKTQTLREHGGFPNFKIAFGDEDLLIVKLCLDSFVAFSPRSTYRKLWAESSDGLAVDIGILAKGIREFLGVLDRDAELQAYAARRPNEWKESKRYLVDMAWKTYHERWADMYRKRLSSLDWFKAAFRLPFIPEYYREVAYTLRHSLMAATLKTSEKRVP
jgi:glycosyltransferase involved in cell wall biosynthesis